MDQWEDRENNQLYPFWGEKRDAFTLDGVMVD
jgi:hypothetical protein